MTKTQIIAELRRSAMEDNNPWIRVQDDAFRQAEIGTVPFRWIALCSNPEACRIFFLLVACALESE